MARIVLFPQQPFTHSMVTMMMTMWPDTFRSVRPALVLELLLQPVVTDYLVQRLL